MRIALRLWVGRLYISSRVFDSRSAPRAALIRTEDENETRQKTIHRIIAVGGRRVPIPGVGSGREKTFWRSKNCVASWKSGVSHRRAGKTLSGRSRLRYARTRLHAEDGGRQILSVPACRHRRRHLDGRTLPPTRTTSHRPNLPRHRLHRSHQTSILAQRQIARPLLFLRHLLYHRAQTRPLRMLSGTGRVPRNSRRRQQPVIAPQEQRDKGTRRGGDKENPLPFPLSPCPLVSLPLSS